MFCEGGMSRIIIFLVSVFFMFSGCGTAPDKSGNDELVRSSKKDRPQWTKSSNVVKRINETLFVGITSGANSEEEAVSSATAKAFAEVSNFFGVSVESNMVAAEQETDGKYSYSLGITSKLTGSSITVKDYMIREKYIEKWHRGNTQYDAYILLSVPNREMARIRIESEGAGTIAFLSDNEMIKDEIKNFTKVLAKKKGIKFRKKSIKLDKDYEVSQVMPKAGTAYLLAVNLKEGKPEEHDGEWYVEMKIEVELVSLLSGKIIETWTAETKGGAFSEKDCRINGSEQIVKKITEQLG